MKLKVNLGIWFIIAVILPSFFLSYLAISTVSREEAFLEKRLQDSLQTEVSHVASLIKRDLNSVQQELERSLRGLPVRQGAFEMARTWQRQQNLVDIPFFLTLDRRILWPTFNGTSRERDFLQWSSGFLMDQDTTPVYEHIALVYKNKFISGPQATPTPQPEQSSWGGGEQKSSFIQRLSFKGQKVRSAADDIGDQYSVAQVSQYEPYYLESVYDEARAKGQGVAQRNILPQTVNVQGKQDFSSSQRSGQQESVFISEDLHFGQIMQYADTGMIPFMIRDRLRLLFWTTTLDDLIAGCLIDQDQLIGRIVRLLPVTYSNVRVLTVLDENGKPLINPDNRRTRNWRQPFVASEISELLPRWEVTAYLTDPQAIASKARATELFTWILIFILMVSILTGGTLVLRSLNSEIRLAQQKTTFAANVSHELKTPLTSIRMFTEMLKDKPHLEEPKRQQYFTIMLSETERLTRLINNVLDFARMGRRKKAYKMKPLNIVQLCRTLVEGQRMRLEYKGFRVNFHSPVDNITVAADEEALKQVLLNLISNAEKYSREIKEITTEIAQTPQGVEISILDRGIGIPKPHAPKIFDEFYRVDDSLTAKTRGTGLGLTIARQIIQDHRGTIIYRDRPGGGSIFQIDLPAQGNQP